MNLSQDTLSKTESGVRLDAEVRTVSDDTVEVTYRIKNENDADVVFVFNRLWNEMRSSSEFQTDINLVYIEPTEEGVIVSKRIPAIPEGIAVEQPMVPCATQVLPGGEVEETFRVAVPLEPYVRYGKPNQAFLTGSASLYLEIGVVKLPPQWVSRMTKAAATTEGQAYSFDTPPGGHFVMRLGPFGSVSMH